MEELESNLLEKRVILSWRRESYSLKEAMPLLILSWRRESYSLGEARSRTHALNDPLQVLWCLSCVLRQDIDRPLQVLQLRPHTLRTAHHRLEGP